MTAEQRAREKGVWQVGFAGFEDRMGHSQGMGATLEARRGTKNPSPPRQECGPANTLVLAQ